MEAESTKNCEIDVHKNLHETLIVLKILLFDEGRAGENESVDC